MSILERILSIEKRFMSRMTPVNAFAPGAITGSWVANTTYTGFWKRIIDIAEIEILVRTSAAPTSTTLTVDIPFQIDTSKMTSNSRENPLIGQCFLHDDGVQNYAGGPVTYGGAAKTVQPFYDNGSGILTAITQAAPFTFGANDEVKLLFRVPIVGWR